MITNQNSIYFVWSALCLLCSFKKTKPIINTCFIMEWFYFWIDMRFYNELPVNACYVCKQWRLISQTQENAIFEHNLFGILDWERYTCYEWTFDMFAKKLNFLTPSPCECATTHFVHTLPLSSHIHTQTDSLWTKKIEVHLYLVSLS